MPQRSLLIIVPAWNEEATVGHVIREIAEKVPHADVLVVNDGSTDRTTDVARAAGAQVLELPVNLGVGGAMRAGYKYAFRAGYDRTVQLDADGQHDPGLVMTLLESMDELEADVLIGARFAGVGDYQVRGPRWWSMRVLSTTLSRVCRTRLTDTTSGFKACNRQAIRLFAANYPAEYLGDTIESLVVAARAGLRIRQVGVAMRERAGGRPSHNPVKAGIFLVRAVLALVIALSRPSEPVVAEGVAA
ncbi:glycosyltransferase family 2 protein [Cellulomonas fimi]|uniref:Glycosyl transferase family 2 n=1 Tax=Cellulomonas fimi (strain ATCC 484 / DSM 20113 / JCM 1341 / CCUG 24087 / LMG 16345 / NBRC 15513 / NCIMB 8980 / NCTC 7547 / NRS-133) TaxID=590998 RepID=F4H4F2_CELFA|nr:glycosyltransferase family 2 protein [Cellulomonas fimi]AEE46628.1 glycosyl transferase family 2 [Cellulomonas fimi ATCC 484]NNH08341.1 glycosyltransferase family 2 protein [Cellulomonas fimi]VEH33705.1 4,4'-diaponeurosporenoate glycosyltransferase [Cellulomonas fimi]